MADDPIVTDAGWTCTITADSTDVSLSGILGTASGAERGDFILGADGTALALAGSGVGVTLLRPAPAAAAGTFQFAWMRGPHRSLEALSTIKSNDVYARLSLMASDGRSIPVIAWQNAPPSTPAHGDRYLVATGSGAWAGHNGQFAEYNTSGTAGWLFVTPKTGWSATYNDGSGRPVRLQFTGSSWQTPANLSSDVAVTPTGGISATNVQAALAELDTEKAVRVTTTTVGRLPRFTDTAGGMGQTAMSEDGSGNVSLAGALSAVQSLQVSGTGDVFTRLNQSSVALWDLVNKSGTGSFALQPNGGSPVLTITTAGAATFASTLAAQSLSLTGALSAGGAGTFGGGLTATSLTLSGQAAVEANLAGDLWYRIRNLNANGRAGQLYGNDQNAAYGAFFLNGSTKTDYAGANSFNMGSFGAVPLGLFTSAETRLTISASGGYRLHTLGPGTVVADAGGNLSVSSSRDLKDDIQEWDDGDDGYLDVAPVSFRWNARSGMDRMNRYHGFIAEEMEERLPECVGMNPDGTPSFSWLPLVAKMTRTMKRLKARIEALEAT